MQKLSHFSPGLIWFTCLLQISHNLYAILWIKTPANLNSDLNQNSNQKMFIFLKSQTAKIIDNVIIGAFKCASAHGQHMNYN